MSDRLFSGSAERNTAPIGDVLQRFLPERGAVLEIASGSGQHASAFAARFPGLRWQPSDPDAGARHSIATYANEDGSVPEAPLDLDVADPAWPDRAAGPYDAIYTANLLHISPWRTALGLFAGSPRVLKPGGLLLVYGPFVRSGDFVGEGNIAFDRSLRGRDPAWGIRDLDDVLPAAAGEGLRLRELVEMPANNALLVFAGP